LVIHAKLKKKNAYIQYLFEIFINLFSTKRYLLVECFSGNAVLVDSFLIYSENSKKVTLEIGLFFNFLFEPSQLFKNNLLHLTY